MADLYFANVAGDNSWGNVDNWYFTYNVTIGAEPSTPTEGDIWYDGVDPVKIYDGVYGWVIYSNILESAPWADGSYASDDLHRSAASVATFDNVYMDVVIGDGLEITGTCDISYIEDPVTSDYGRLLIVNTVYNGNFSGDNVTLGTGTTLYGGNFTGNDFYAPSSNIIYGGNFSGDNGLFYSTTIYGGNFSGDYFAMENGEIINGYFAGNNFIFMGSAIIRSGIFIITGADISFGVEIGGGFFKIDTLTLNSSSVNNMILTATNTNGTIPIDSGFYFMKGNMTLERWDGINVLFSSYGTNLGILGYAEYGWSKLEIKGQDVLSTSLL